MRHVRSDQFGRNRDIVCPGERREKQTPYTGCIKGHGESFDNRRCPGQGIANGERDRYPRRGREGWTADHAREEPVMLIEIDAASERGGKCSGRVQRQAEPGSVELVETETVVDVGNLDGS